MCETCSTMVFDSFPSTFEIENCVFVKFGLKLFVENACGFSLQLPQCGEATTTQLFLQSTKYCIITWTYIRRVRWVLNCVARNQRIGRCAPQELSGESKPEIHLMIFCSGVCQETFSGHLFITACLQGGTFQFIDGIMMCKQVDVC